MAERIIERIRKNAFYSPEKAIKGWTRNLHSSDSYKGNILITALRNGTWIEWAVYSAFVFKQMGYNTTLFFKKSETDKQYKNNSFWKLVSQTSFISLVDLDGFEPNQEIIAEYQKAKPNFIYDALAYNHHLEREDIIFDEEKYTDEINDLILESARAHQGIISVLGASSYHRFICYSGLIQTTPTLLQTAQKAGIETVCIEGWSWRPGHVIFNFNKPALEYNIKGWMKYYGWDPAQNKTVDEYLAFQDGQQLKDKSWLNNFYNVQQSKIDGHVNQPVLSFLEKHKNSFLLAPNVIGDSSTLNRETIFRSMRIWIREVIDFFKSNPQYTLIIRAHPAEVWVKSKVKFKLGDYAESLSKGYDNILVIKGEEKINSFYLLPYIKCGLVWLSSIGVDMVVRGIPVVCAASPKYSGLDFVHEPPTKKEYFNLIQDYAQEARRPTSEQERENARKYLYVVFKGFSFPAQGSDYSARTLTLNHMPFQSEHDRFYSILTGETERPDAAT